MIVPIVIGGFVLVGAIALYKATRDGAFGPKR